MLNSLKRSPGLRRLLGFEETLWTRKVSDQEVRKLVRHIQPAPVSVLEISGRVWEEFGFSSYQAVGFPEFDLCQSPLPERFDLVIVEHVFEHLLTPRTAAINLHTMLNPNGHALLVTPFIYKVHPNPHDCTRWTCEGLEAFLIECGFASVVTGSWGNRACIKATMRKEYRLFNRHIHSLVNEPSYPVVVWALARSG